MATPVLDTFEAWWRACDYDGSGTLADGSGNGHNAQLGSAAGADTNDPLFLSPDGYVDYANPGTQYLYLPGTTGNYASTPDSVPLSFTDAVELTWHGRMPDYTPSSTKALIGKWTAGQEAFLLRLETSGKLRLFIKNPGVDSTIALSSVFADDQDAWVKATWRTSDKRVQFFTSSDGVVWNQLGTDGVVNDVLPDRSSAIEIGSYQSGASSPMVGRVYRAIVKSGIDGTTVFDANFTDRTNGTLTFTEDSANAATVTINRSATGRKSTVVDYPLMLLGTDDYLRVADHANLDFAAGESMTALAVARTYDTTPAADSVLIAKKDNLTTAAGWALYNDTTGPARFLIADGTADDEDDAPALADGVRFGVGGVRNVGTDTVEAYKDGVASGSPVTDTTTNTLANALPVRIGATSGTAASFWNGEFFGAGIYRGVLSAVDMATAIEELIGNEASGIRLLAVGALEVNAVYVGANPATKVYLGAVQVFG